MNEFPVDKKKRQECATTIRAKKRNTFGDQETQSGPKIEDKVKQVGPH